MQNIPEEMTELLIAMNGKMLRLEARCDALETVVIGLSAKAGVPLATAAKAIQDMTAAQHQKYLERVEAASPGLAAKIDTRPGLPDLPEGLL